MKILLLGKNGQVGWELQRSLAPIGDVIALERNKDKNINNLCGDLTDLEGLKLTINTLKPDVIINAAAYTSVDNAEKETHLAHLINFQAPKLIAEESSKINALLIHYSTDYVFDGTKNGAWNELDSPNPINYYGKTKFDAELAIQSSKCRHLIFRTSWVYASRGNNFAKTMLSLAKERTKISVINDQYGAPTSADLIADCTAHALIKVLDNPNLEGLYHLTATGAVSWYDFAEFVINYAKSSNSSYTIEEIIPIKTIDYNTLAKRPLNSKLDTNKLREAFHLTLPNWQEGVSRMLEETIL